MYCIVSTAYNLERIKKEHDVFGFSAKDIHYYKHKSTQQNIVYKRNQDVIVILNKSSKSSTSFSFHTQDKKIGGGGFGE